MPRRPLKLLNRSLRLVLVTSALIACAAASSMQGSGASPQARGASAINLSPIIFGGEDKYAPFHFLEQGRDPRGFTVDLFRAVAEREGRSVEFRLDKWPLVLDRLASGEVDVVPMFDTTERRERYLFSAPFLQRHHLVFGRQDAEFISELEQLRGKRVAAQFKGLAWEELAGLIGVLLVPVEVEGDALLAVAEGLADFAVVPMLIGYEARLRLQLENVVALSSPVLARDYAFAARPGREDLIAEINRGLQQVSRDGVQDRLYVRWLANLVAPEESYRAGLLIGLALALPLLALVVLAWMRWRRARQQALQETASRQLAEERAQYLAFHDPVTGLPNRNGLRQQLGNHLVAGRRCALVRIDMLDLGSVEAIAGQEFVEQLLRDIGTRLKQLPGALLVAAVGRRGFDVLFDHVNNEEDAVSAIETAVTAVQSPFELEGVPIEQTCHAGVAVFPSHGSNAATLLRAAGVACAAARDRGMRSLLYEPSLEPDPRNLTLLAELRDAIRNQTLSYVVQPKLDFSSRRWVGAELLVRWQHPHYGPLLPGAFVPLAERTGVVGEMTTFLVKRAADHCRDWVKRGLDLTLSVNVSVNDLADPKLASTLIESCAGIESCIMFEVTETEVMRNADQVAATVERLRNCGIRVSLDDFGTGHSSLTYLRQLAPNEIKIDRSFVAEILRSPADQAIVRSMISLAHSLSAKVTAEGIEDAETLAWLEGAGCDLAQGYHVAKPMALADFIAHLKRQREDEAAE